MHIETSVNPERVPRIEHFIQNYAGQLAEGARTILSKLYNGEIDRADAERYLTEDLAAALNTIEKARR